jgi:hypothetical protein
MEIKQKEMQRKLFQKPSASEIFLVCLPLAGLLKLARFFE